MTEFWLILAINAAGLTFSLLLARWLTARDAGAVEIRRLGSAIERATKGFLAREYRVIAALSGLLALLGIALHAGLGRIAGSSVQTGAWTALGIVAGAAACSIVTHVGADLSVRGTLRALAGTELSLDRGLMVSLRSGGVVAVLVETASALGVFGLLALGFALRGAPAGAEPAAALMPLVTTLLPGFALGAVTAALTIQRGGSTYHTASDVAADFAGEREFALDHDDARNPAVVSDLVGDHVGSAAARTADHFITATGANIAALLVGAALFQANRDSFTLLTFPIALRAFGVLSLCFGIMVVRGDDTGAMAGIWRGYASTAVIALSGLAGVGIWLLGGAIWIKLLLAGAVGLSAATLAAWATRLRVERRYTPLREALDALRLGEATAVSQGIGAGLGALLVPALLLGSALVLAYQLGAATGLARGGLLGVHTALTLMLAGGAYAAAVVHFAPIADGARGIANMALRDAAVDVQRRAAKLDDTGFSCGVPAQTYLVISAGASALLTAALLPITSQGPGAALSLELRGPVAPLCAALGAAFALSFVGAAVRSATAAARAVALEVDRQLRNFQKDRIVPRDFTPSYRACIELCVDAALRRLPLVVAVALSAPLLVGAGLALASRIPDATPAVFGLTWFSLLATATGIAIALIVEGARSTLSATRRASPTREGSQSFAASLGVDAVADVLGGSALPTAHLVIKSTALVALAVAPFLT